MPTGAQECRLDDLVSYLSKHSLRLNAQNQTFDFDWRRLDKTTSIERSILFVSRWHDGFYFKPCVDDDLACRSHHCQLGFASNKVA